MRHLILCFVLFLSFFDGASAQVDKYKMELQHQLVFKDTVFSRIRLISGQFSKMPARPRPDLKNRDSYTCNQ